MSRRLGLSSLALLLCIPAGYAQEHFMFEFPSAPSQCELVNVSWTGGAPPFKVYIGQIFGQLFEFDWNDNYNTGAGTIQLPLSIASGQNYVAFMGDANGIGSGGSSIVQTSQDFSSTVPFLDNCVNNPVGKVSLDFTFTISGQAKQCARGFEMSWSGGQEDGPYNFTVIPLDQGFFPFDVPLENGVKSMSDWMLNMTAGTRFTVMMNSAKGYGRGGVAGIYEVADSSDESCVVQPTQSTGSWPNNIQTNTLDSATLPITSGSSASASSSPSSSSGISGGAIAGIVVGVVAVLAIVAFAIWFLIRRRRRREATNEKLRPDPMDLGEGSESSNVGEDDETAAFVEPFPGTPPLTSRQSLVSRGYDDRSGGYRDSDVSMAAFNPGNAYDLGGEDANPSGPGIAPALAPKSPAIPSPSTSSRFATEVTGSGSRKSDFEQPPPQPSQQRQGQLRVVNHDDPSVPTVPSLPPGAAADGTPRSSSGGRRGSGVGPEGPSAAFRRHADAGRVQQEVVDLPPLYTDVPRDDDPPRQRH